MKIVVKIIIFLLIGYLTYSWVINLEEGQSISSDSYKTAYYVFCNQPALDAKSCEVKDTGVPINFSIYLDQQKVVSWFDDSLLGQNKNVLSNCIVVDDNNWSCDSMFRGKQGFNKGIYFNESSNDDALEEEQGYTLTVSKKDWENINKKLYK